MSYLQVMEEDEVILRQKLKDLKFFDGIALYYDKTATLRREAAGLESDGNYSLVTEDGQFLFELNNRKSVNRFSEYININEYGLFTAKNPYGYETYVDNNGFAMSMNTFQSLISNLKNRRGSYTPEEFTKMIYGLDIFMADNYIDGHWTDSLSGLKELGFDQERADGLVFFTGKYNAGGRDYNHWVMRPYVGTKGKNEMTFENFYFGLRMLENGRKRLLKMTTHFWHTLHPTVHINEKTGEIA